MFAHRDNAVRGRLGLAAGLAPFRCRPAAGAAALVGVESATTKQGGGTACFAPVTIEGRVFDFANRSAIADARVVAINASGIVISSVAVTAEDWSSGCGWLV